jgi:chemotaxis protein MotA
MVLEGGKLGDIVQVTAGLIVLGGTLGAVMVNSPPAVLWRAARRLSTLFRPEHIPTGLLIEDLVACAAKARKHGLLSLEADVQAARDPFLRKALALAVDGAGIDVLREDMELEISLEEQRLDDEARVYEAAGGYAPTIGIIGAVLGLIQVMKHLDNISEVGHGIAVAFVATVYGVGLANLALLPAAGKLRALAAHRIRMREMVLEGVLAIVEGRNPKLLRSKLEAYEPAAARAVVEPEAKSGHPLVLKQGRGR